MREDTYATSIVYERQGLLGSERRLGYVARLSLAKVALEGFPVGVYVPGPHQRSRHVRTPDCMSRRNVGPKTIVFHLNPLVP